MLRICMTTTVDGLFIRSLLCSFFFKLYPEIIEDGRLFIAEPPLYQVADKDDPFVINKEDYIDRYIRNVIKDYKIGKMINEETEQIEWFDKNKLYEFLSDTSAYVEDVIMLAEHYNVNDRLIEIILEEYSYFNKIDIDRLMKNIQIEFPELYYDDKSNVIKGVIDGKYQLLEITPRLLEKASPIIDNIRKYQSSDGSPLIIKSNNGGNHQESLLQLLKILKKYQPTILYRYKGFGENTDSDLSRTIMDPNTRTLIRLYIEDMKNDLKIFQLIRGNSQHDASNRKRMMEEFSHQITRDIIDT